MQTKEQNPQLSRQLRAMQINSQGQVYRRPTRRHCSTNTGKCNTQNTLIQTGPRADAVQPMHTSAKQHHSLATSLEPMQLARPSCKHWLQTHTFEISVEICRQQLSSSLL
ncbi:hypothetical protein Nepgr_014784 [Nepenthes gracilis]|uniref:Uncharacterized protein n=1 Tax=Nepenthes gracilis TaxID=150966 RepID=A0AAD3XQ61_NEPGR|nr:hypothetical protein Nepgr_014784 [Nepenthes gracilis]